MASDMALLDRFSELQSSLHKSDLVLLLANCGEQLDGDVAQHRAALLDYLRYNRGIARDAASAFDAARSRGVPSSPPIGRAFSAVERAHAYGTFA